MKRKIVFGALFFTFFAFISQSVFAQNISFQLNQFTVISGQEDVTNRIQSIGGQMRDDGLAIIINYKDGSKQSFAFIDIDEVDDGYGYTTWSNIRIVNPNTSSFSSERFTGKSKIHLDGTSAFQFSIKNSQGATIWRVGGVMRFM
ncbi:MAG: hypothetical protein LBH20_07630 [Treponema sp.]|jgi:hypothetical protein|nr:hypothetical protein [Treponema sp.]